MSTEAGKQANLKVLHFYDNLFEGTLQSELENLGFLGKKWNKLGGMYTKIATCSDVFLYYFAAYMLHMNQNDFVGTLPTEMGHLTLLASSALVEGKQI
jgi:hypothetical protein